MGQIPTGNLASKDSHYEGGAVAEWSKALQLGKIVPMVTPSHGLVNLQKDENSVLGATWSST